MLIERIGRFGSAAPRRFRAFDWCEQAYRKFARSIRPGPTKTCGEGEPAATLGIEIRETLRGFESLSLRHLSPKFSDWKERQLHFVGPPALPEMSRRCPVQNTLKFCDIAPSEVRTGLSLA